MDSLWSCIASPTEDAKKLKATGLDKKAKTLAEVVREEPFRDVLAHESLVGNLSDLCSRRINLQHRFVYQVRAEPVSRDGVDYDGTVRILRMWTHYEGL